MREWDAVIKIFSYPWLLLNDVERDIVAVLSQEKRDEVVVAIGFRYMSEWERNLKY